MDIDTRARIGRFLPSPPHHVSLSSRWYATLPLLSLSSSLSQILSLGGTQSGCALSLRALRRSSLVPLMPATCVPYRAPSQHQRRRRRRRRKTSSERTWLRCHKQYYKREENFKYSRCVYTCTCSYAYAYTCTYTYRDRHRHRDRHRDIHR